MREQRLEGVTPAWAQGRDTQRALELAAAVPRQIEQRVDLEDTHAFRARADLDDLIPGFHLAFLKNTEIETGPAVRNQQRSHLRFIHADTNAVTGDARLRHFEQSTADPVAVANADLPVRKAVDREVLPELSVGEIIAAKLALPIAIGVDLIDENGAVLAAVANQVSLPIAIDIEPADRARTLNRCLPNGGVDGLPLPGDICGRPTFRESRRAVTFVSFAGGRRRLLSIAL